MKKQAWENWINRGSKELYQIAKREARRQVYLARVKAERKRFANILQHENWRGTIVLDSIREN